MLNPFKTVSKDPANPIVRPLAFSPDGQYLASVEDRETLRLWEKPFAADTNGRNLSLAEHPGARAIAFGPTFLATADDDGAVHLWDKSTRRLSGTRRGHNGAVVHAVAFNSGDLLATGGADGTVQLWDTATGDSLLELNAHEGGVHTLAFSPRNPKLLATGGADGRVRLWDVVTGEKLGVDLRGHVGPVNVVAFDRDGARLASGSGDKTVLVWQLSDADTLASKHPIILEEHTKWVESLAFSPDGKTLVSGSADRTVLRWIIDVEALADAVCDAVGYENLSEDDWRTYIPKVEYRETCPQPSPSPTSSPNRPAPDQEPSDQEPPGEADLRPSPNEAVMEIARRERRANLPSGTRPMRVNPGL